MTGTLGHLALASLIFFGAHIGISSTPLRAALVKMMGERIYLLAYSILMLALLVWMVIAFNAAPDVVLWDFGVGVRHLSLLVMWVAFILFASAMSPNAPAVAGAPEGAITRAPIGMFKITRHPMLWSFAIWGLMHLAANGDAASLIFFGALTVLAVVGTFLIDHKKHAALGSLWDRYAAQSSNIPFYAVVRGHAKVGLGEIGWKPWVYGTVFYVIVVSGHGFVLGVSPLPF